MNKTQRKTWAGNEGMIPLVLPYIGGRFNKTAARVLTAAFLALVVSTSVQAGDPAAGQRKSQTCVACHGPDGNSPAPDFPKIAGQHYDYLVKTLMDYKSGARKNPIMAPMAAPLTVRDIRDLAAFYSSQKGLTLKY